MRLTACLTAVLAFAPFAAHAGSLSTYKVSFSTLSCDGTKGMASVDADHIVKIESQKCEPGEPVAEVYQILVTGEKVTGSTYRVFTTTEKEAQKIQKKVDEYQEAKKKSVEKGDRIIINRER